MSLMIGSMIEAIEEIEADGGTIEDYVNMSIEATFGTLTECVSEEQKARLTDTYKFRK